MGCSDAGHAQRGELTGAPDHRGGLFDLGSFVVGEVVQVLLDPVDQILDPADLLLGRQRLGLGPVVQIGGGEDAFAVTQQVVQVGGEIGQVGDVGAEVVAAHAAEPERAGSAAGLDVGGLVAGAVGDGDLADGPTSMFGVEQGLSLPPDMLAVRSNWWRVTLSTASRCRWAPTR